MNVPEVRPDVSRGERVGLDEAIFCAGKNASQIELILGEARTRGARLLLTRLATEQVHDVSADACGARLRSAVAHCILRRGAHRGRRRRLASPYSPPARRICPRARQCARSPGTGSSRRIDVGVAGLWRLSERLEQIRRFPVLIVAAGMDAALVSVVGGLVRGCVIGLPTSIGYGVASGGRTALDAMLASCAPGVAVVNIDNGYGAACIALRMLRAFAPPV
jgi:NCAIR mutase (PurE)-related protein